MKEYQWLLLRLYVGTIASFTLLSHFFEIPDSVFNNKRNPLNVIFVKMGWLWTSAPVLIFMLTTSHFMKKSKIKAVGRWILATLYWIMASFQSL
jgi:hypothetical protein